MWCPSGWHFIHNFLKSTSHMKSLGTFLYHSERRTKCQPVVTLILWLSDQSCQKNSTCSKALVGDIIIKSSRYLFTHGPLLRKMCTLIKYSHRKKTVANSAQRKGQASGFVPWTLDLETWLYQWSKTHQNSCLHASYDDGIKLTTPNSTF